MTREKKIGKGSDGNLNEASLLPADVRETERENAVYLH